MTTFICNFSFPNKEFSSNNKLMLFYIYLKYLSCSHSFLLFHLKKWISENIAITNGKLYSGNVHFCHISVTYQRGKRWRPNIFNTGWYFRTAFLPLGWQYAHSREKKMRTRRDDAIGFRAQAKARYEKYTITHFPK